MGFSAKIMPLYDQMNCRMFKFDKDSDDYVERFLANNGPIAWNHMEATTSMVHRD
jgi:hypothetical protein